jgi:DNA-binding transcriptional MerR regulator
VSTDEPVIDEADPVSDRELLADAPFPGSELPDKLFFRIGEAAEIVGVEPHVLRYWETEFKLRPKRSSSGQRLYRRQDIARFLRIKRLLHEEGFTIAGARKALAEPGTEPLGPSTADTGRIGEALDRITELRARIASLRERYAQVSVAARGDQR